MKSLKRAGLIQSVRAKLEALQAAVFRLSSDVYDEAITLGDGPRQDNLTNA
jgi:predicted nucleic acid-binding protein